MKFVELHLIKSNKKMAVNPHLITAITVTADGNTRIYYTDLSQHDDVKEEYEVVLMRIHDAL